VTERHRGYADVVRGRQNGARTEPYERDGDEDLVRRYLNQIGKTELLTAEQEVELAKRVEAGVYAAHLLHEAQEPGVDLPAERRRDLEEVAEDGRRAKDHMIRANLRLVVSAAKTQLHRGVPFLDVIQEGNLGLIRAVEKFDYRKGFKFSTYAMWWIRQSIQRGLAEQARAVRLPSHVVEEIAKVGRVERQLQLRLGREPTVEELAEGTGFSGERVEELRRLAREVISLDTPVGEEGDTTVSDLVADTEAVEPIDLIRYREFREELRALVDALPPREAMIICLRYGLHDGEPRTLEEVARRQGLTVAQTRLREREALAKLRDPERNQVLLSWAS
jgi:RNA polymerase sigma factor (sigma-70 family)